MVPEAWKTYFNLGLVYKHQSNFQKADEFFKRAYILNDGNSVLLAIMGRNLMALQKYEEAEKKLMSSYRIDSLDKHTCEALGEVYTFLKKYEKSRIFFKRSITIDPNFRQGHINLAILLLNYMNQVENGVYHLKRGIKLGVEGPQVSKLSKKYGITSVK